MTPSSSATESKKNVLFKEGEPRIWALYYMFGTSSPQQKLFSFDGDMQGATMRARKHCEIMHYRFIRVRPGIVDLDYQESQYMNGKWKDPDTRE